MKFGVTCQPDDARRLRIARMVVESLQGRADVVAEDDVAEALGGGIKGEPLEKMDVDVLVTVGGDGTILHALQKCDAPVFGINAGEIGFLTEIEPIELGDAFDRLLAGDYAVEERTKISTRINGERLPDVVNETVIKTPKPAKLLHFEVRAGPGFRMRLRADGVIFATPTGSTSYAMSAGGPIMDPAVRAMLMVPIAAFSLGSRPMVFPADANLELSLVGRAERQAVVVLDGQAEHHITPDDLVTVTTSEHRARFARLQMHFYDRLKERLS